MDCKTLKSEIDSSVNFIVPTQDGGYFESRYVRRYPEYIVCYLSSQSGCNRGCNFCHLTATGQTMFYQATIPDFIDQTEKVLNHYFYNPGTVARYVHFNWMSRGEALCNPTILEDSTMLLDRLARFSEFYKLIPKFNLSTIMPRTLDKSLDEIFPLITPTIYYSIYSMNKDFRKKWLPGAMEPEQALDMLKNYQDYSKKLIKLHFALIKDENDRLEDIEAIVEAVKAKNLAIELNLVQYNPPDDTSEESLRYSLYLQTFKELIGERCREAKVIRRIGQDIFASCGTFYS